MGKIRVTTPAGLVGAANIVITNPDGKTAVIPFIYGAPPPSVASVDPSYGPVEGGTDIVLVGADFHVDAVTTIGGAYAAVTGSPSPPPPIELASIAITPASPSVEEGQTLQFTATGTYDDGSTVDLTLTATWASSDTSTATINALGLASGVAGGGTTDITATFDSHITFVSNVAVLGVTALPSLPVPSITTSSPMPGGTVNGTYAQILAATGGDGSYTWALFNATTLPAGLTLNAATGLVSGTPTTVATTGFEVEVTSDGQTATATLEITVAVESTLPSFSTETASYNTAFDVAGDIRWAADAALGAWDRTYYDRSYFWYALGEPARGDVDQQNLMDTYWDANGSSLPPRAWEPDGLIEHYLRNSDANLLNSLRDLAAVAQMFLANYVDGYGWEGRIQERALLVFMAADAMNVTPTYDWRESARTVKNAILTTQNPDGSWTPPNSAYTAFDPNTGHDGDGQVSSNFMSVAGMSGLLRYAEYYDDDVANILATVDLGAEWLWTTQWRVADQSFNYWSAAAGGGMDSDGVPLNMMFVDVFGWLYYKTGDAKWITRGDQIFVGALNSASYNANWKQFNQFFRNSWRYLYYRDGYDISILQNPIEVHR